MSGALQFVTLPGRRLDLGIQAHAVRGVELASEWMDVSPLDLERALPWDAVTGAAPRVLIIRTHTGEVPVAAPGAVGLWAAEPSAVLPLPPEALQGASASLFEAVVVEEAARPILVLSTEGLGHLFQRSL